MARIHFIGGAAISSAAVASACLCPPCPGDTPAAAAAPAEAAAAPAEAVPAGGRRVIWDGDGNGYQAGKGWADCDKKPDCKSTVEVAKGVGRNGSVGMKLHTEGPGWNGAGWNWVGWYPENGGTDLRAYQNVTFWIRVEAKSPDLAPAPDSLAFALGCSKGKKNSADIPILRFQREIMDGQWHQVVVPLSEFSKGKDGKEFDPATAWEFRFFSWSGNPRTFDVYIDDVAVEKP
jgi:hypothetical protein